MNFIIVDTFIIDFSKAIGFVIAIIICYDILEILGDLLGAPSLQSSKVLSKMI